MTAPLVVLALAGCGGVHRMWFPGKPYPGHDSDERVPISDPLKP